MRFGVESSIETFTIEDLPALPDEPSGKRLGIEAQVLNRPSASRSKSSFSTKTSLNWLFMSRNPRLAFQFIELDPGSMFPYGPTGLLNRVPALN